jgi:hypothetical protein
MQDLEFIPNHQIERARRRTQALVDSSQGVPKIAALNIPPGLAEIELTAIPADLPEQLVTNTARPKSLSAHLTSRTVHGLLL